MPEPILEPHDEMPNILDLSQENAFDSHISPVTTTSAASPPMPEFGGECPVVRFGVEPLIDPPDDLQPSALFGDLPPLDRSNG